MNLRKQDYALLFGAAVAAATCCVASSRSAPPWNITIPLVIVLWILLFVCLICYRNLLRHMRVFAEEQAKSAMVNYRQLESSLWLAATIKVRQPLPFMRGMAISPDFAILLAQVIYSRKPQVILELGCGTSTLISSYILEQLGSGRVVSIDHDVKFAGICRKQLEQHGLSSRSHIFDCPLTTQRIDGASYQYYDLSLAEIPENVDVLIVDGPPQWIQPQARYPALPLLLSRLSRSAVILVDDAVRPDEQAIVDRWLTQFTGFQKTYIDTEKGTIILYRED